MVNWSDPEVVAYNFFVYEQIGIFLLGFYGTYFLKTLHVEWELLTRKRALRVVHLPYFTGRYICLAALLFFDLQGRVKARIACDFAFRFFASLGSLAGMTASCIICSRPAAIFWTLKLYAPLALLATLALGQATIVVLQGVLSVRAMWNAETAACMLYKWDHNILTVFFGYTFGFDVTIFILTLFAVRRVQQEHGKRKRWTVGNVLCIQGIGYVAATCLVNVPVAVLAVVNLNASMDVLLSLPALAISVIVSSLTLFALEDHGHKTTAAQAAAAAGTAAGASDAPVTSMTTDTDGTGTTLTSAHGFSVTSQIPVNMTLMMSTDEVLDGDLAVLESKPEETAPAPPQTLTVHFAEPADMV